MKETFLTEAQRRVLELKARGMRQAEIARLLKTSRANVSILERRARKNIAKAERTVKLAARLKSPVVLEVKAASDLFSIPKKIFRLADGAGIQVKLTAPDIVAKIRQQAGDKIHGRSVKEPFEIAVTSDGEIIL